MEDIKLKLFTVGPVQSYQDTLDSGSEQLPYFRTEEFSTQMLQTSAKIKSLAATSSDSKIAFLTASGTGAMEAAVINVFSSSDRVLIISGGSFGKRFEQICDIHNIPHDSIRLAFGETLTLAHLDAFKNTSYAGMLVNIHETSTGQLYDVKILSEFCKAKDMYLIVDSISSFLADPYRMDEFGIDLTILSSQKGLSVNPGISLILANEKIVSERINRANPNSLYFDLKDYFLNFERGQTPFTPAVGILFQIARRVDILYQKGIDNYLAETAHLASDFRSKVKQLSSAFLVPDYPLSNALTPLICRNGNAKFIFEQLKNRFGIFVTPNGGDLADRVLRVGHLGNLTISDNNLLISKLKEVLEL